MVGRAPIEANPFMAFEIQRSEHNLIRVFAVNRPAHNLRAALAEQDKTDLIAELLGQDVPKDGAELFPVADLAGIGLSGYLEQGYAVSPDQLEDAKARLDALEGYVLLLFSSAFKGRDVTLEPGANLTLIGTFGEEQPDMTPTALQSEAAEMQPTSDLPPSTPPPKRGSGAAIALALIAVAGLALWLALR